MLIVSTLLLLFFAANTASASQYGSPLKIVAFGTSLTSRGGWPQVLEKELGACLKQPVSIKIVALAGATSEWALSQVAWVTAEQPDIVLVELYANDAALDRFIRLSTSRTNIAMILDGLHAGAPQARIVVMAMNPVSGLRGWMRPFLDSYIAAHRQAAESRGMGFVDFRPAWFALPELERIEAIPDGLHPKPEKAGEIMATMLVRYLVRGLC
ncbi:SGNH/GDSL hydrolase family protein (plasmid) [Rhizobium sp. 007]|nr:SGNH/GDSL hydrolase family protein [Rhizobium sp. 007]